jgi:DNA-binding transcriptional ArsR family regulator
MLPNARVCSFEGFECNTYLLRCALIRDGHRMEEGKPEKDDEDVLAGTTLRVYRYLYRQGGPLGVHDVQKGVGFKAPSTAHYHLRKLVESGLVKEQNGRYVVDKVVFENTIRVGKSLIPIQTTLVTFFGTTLFFLLTTLRPSQIYATWATSVVIDCISLVVFSLEAIVTLKRVRAK